MTSASPSEILDAYGFDACPVFGDAEPFGLGQEQPIVDPTAQGLAFYSQAKAQLGGTVSAVEDQALAAINSWPGQAQSAVLSYLDPGEQALLASAMQGVQIAEQGGLSPQTFFAIAGLVATEIGGPVAGAVVGSMLVTLDVMRDAIISVAAQLGVPTAKSVARSADFLCYSGWPKQGQVLPGGPADAGDGTEKNPGWQRIWDQIETYAPKFTQCRQVSSGVWEGDTSSDAMGQWIAALPPALNQMWAGALVPLGLWCELQHLPKTDFRWFYYPLRYMNVDFIYNCSPIAPVDEQALLLKTADIWNRTHAATTTMAFAPGDGTPIGGVLGGLSNLVWQPGQPSQKTSVGPLTIHTGPAIADKRVIAIHLPHGASPAASVALTPGQAYTITGPVDPNVPPAAFASSVQASLSGAGAAGPQWSNVKVAITGATFTATATYAGAPQSVDAGTLPAGWTIAPAAAPTSSAAPVVATLAVASVAGAAWWLLGKPLTLAALKHGWGAIVREFF